MIERKRGTPVLITAFLALCLTASILPSCKGAAIGSDPSDRADLTLSFETPGTPAGGVAASKAISPLLLPAAAKLAVSLTPLDAGLSTPEPQVVPLVDRGAVSVSFEGVEYGRYEVEAVASDSSGKELFKRSSELVVSETSTSATLDLLPANADDTAITGSAYIVVPVTLAAGASVSYSVPVSAVSGGFYSLRFMYLVGDFQVYAQGASGALVLSGSVNAMAGTITTSEGSFYGVDVTPDTLSSPSYLTFYNPTSGSVSFEVMINYPT